jgi:reductive dehalogenase
MPEISEPERVDERDTMFARNARQPGTAAFDEYYARRPELQAVDDRMRALPGLCHPEARFHDPEIAAATTRWFEEIGAIEPDPAVVETWVERIQRADDKTAVIRDMFLALGAVAAGFAPLPEEFIYTVKGRHDEDYGREIHLDHETAAVFLVQMDFDAMQAAPTPPTIEESARQYYRAAEISLTAEAVLKALGSDAKAHYDAHYDVILPPLAVLAGLGELGRNNILIAERHGSRVRIGAVTTTLKLTHDRPIDLGAAKFCEICRKCADNCPSHALSLGERETIRGVAKWPTNVERCFGYWCRTGTDCGICMACCPFSHKNNRFHNTVRWFIRHVPWIHRLALWFDDRIYGRTWPKA